MKVNYDNVDFYNDTDEVVRTVVDSKKRSKLAHPAGILLTMEEGVFLRDSEIEVVLSAKTKLIYTDTAFRVRSTELSVKALCISIKVNYKPISKCESAQFAAIIELREGDKTYLLGGKLELRSVGKNKGYYVTAQCEPFQRNTDVYVGARVFILPTEIDPVFHPVQHQFKIHQIHMQEDAAGNSRRRNSDGTGCDDGPGRPERPQIFYPACYPAAWASLCNAYRLTPQTPRRYWALGTPTESNPPPNESGDYFSTWILGGNSPGSPPAVSRVEDWLADPANPTPNVVVMDSVSFPATSDPQGLSDRAERIKSVLLQEVGGQIEGSMVHLAARPVWMAHSGHAWVIVGVDKDGFWTHASNPNAWAFSNYCSWSQAPWIGDSREHVIKMPPSNCSSKPEERRLGCLNLEGSSDTMKRVRFWDVYTHTGLASNIIHWTPHTRTDPGYLWIQNNVLLTCEGFPAASDYHSDLGHIIPRPINEIGSCNTCGNDKDGCSHCRSRMLLPFWVHNTTRNDLVSYKVDLYFWSKDQRWVSLGAKLLPNTAQSDSDDLHSGFGGANWNNYKLPGPLPGEHFSVQATEDTDTGGNRSVPWNSQGFGWYIDFHRNQLRPGQIQGIRLVLTCAERSGKHICQVQDVKQLWFRVGDPAPA